MSHPGLRSWTRAVLVGALIGLPVLGGGGRAAMWVLAVLTGVPPSFTFEGTLTVLLAGAGSGAVAGAIHQGLRVALPRRRWFRDVAFLIILAALTLRGLTPVRPQPLLVFAPVMMAFAGVFLAASRWNDSRMARCELASLAA
jgi:hypothetical protein